MGLEVFGEVHNPLGEDCDLDFRRTSIGIAAGMLGNECAFALRRNRHRVLLYVVSPLLRGHVKNARGLEPSSLRIAQRHCLSAVFRENQKGAILARYGERAALLLELLR